MQLGKAQSDLATENAENTEKNSEVRHSVPTTIRQFDHHQDIATTSGGSPARFLVPNRGEQRSQKKRSFAFQDAPEYVQCLLGLNPDEK